MTDPWAPTNIDEMRWLAGIAALLSACAGAADRAPAISVPPSTPAREASAPAPPPAGCTADRWCRDLPRVPFHGGRAVWASGPSDIWIAAGSLVHFDGERWSPIPLPTADDVTAIWGTGPRDVYVIAGQDVLRFDGERWHDLECPETQSARTAIWASGPRNVFVADAYHVRRFDGERWDEHPIGASGVSFFGRAVDDLYLALDSGHVAHFDGSEWRVIAHVRGRLLGISGSTEEVVAVGVEPGAYAVRRGRGSFEPQAMSPTASRAVWTAPSGTHVLAGPFDTMLHVAPDGVRSHSARGMRSEWLQAIHGTSDDFAVAVGLYGVIRWDGASWTRIDGERGADLKRVRGAGRDRVIALGERGSYRFDGAAWTGVDAPPAATPALRAVWGSSASDVWAVGDGGRILHWDGAAVSIARSPTSATLHAIWGGARDDVRAVGDAGTIVRWDGSAWTAEPSPTTEPLHAIWGTARGDVWAGGSAGTILRHVGTAWARAESDLRHPIVAIHGTAQDDVWAGGLGGELAHFDGRTWHAQAPLDEPIASLWARSRHALFVATGRSLVRRDAYGRALRVRDEAGRAVAGSGSALLAVGTEHVATYDGTSWIDAQAPARSLAGVWMADRRTAFAVGADGALFRWTAGVWETLERAPEASAPVAGLRAVDGGGGVLAGVRTDGTFAWLDGVERPLPDAAPGALRDVAVRGPTDVVAVGERGRVTQFDGTRWTERTIDGVPIVEHVRVAADGDAIAWGNGAGPGGSQIVRRRARRWESAPLLPRVWHTGVWAGEGTVFGVGWEGRIHQLVDNAWIAHADTRAELTGVTFADARHAFAIGRDGAVERWDGERWSAIEAPGDVWLTEAWASGPNDLWAITPSAVLRWNGSTWSTARAPSRPWAEVYKDVWGTGPDDVHVAGADGEAWRWNGREWQTTHERGGPAVLTGHGRDLFLHTSHPRAILRWDGAAWVALPLPAVQELSSVHAIGAGRLIVLDSAGRFGRFWRFDGAAWSPLTAPDGPSAIFGDETRGLYAFTDYGHRVARFDGSAWHDTGIEIPREALGLASLAVGGGGAVIAVGNRGARWHYDGSSWRDGRRGTTQDLRAVWGSSPTDVWAVGDGGAILHFDGDAWRSVPSGTEETLYAVWGRGPRDVYAVGSHGAVVHFDGARWSGQESGAAGALFDIWGAGDRVFAVGEGGHVLRRELPR